MKRKVSILFVFMLIFQTLTSSFAYPMQILADGVKENQIIKNITVLNEAGDVLDGENLDETTEVDIRFGWSVEGLNVEAGSSENIILSNPIDIQAEQKGELLTTENVVVGQYEASTSGNVKITFSEAIESDEQSAAEGSFVVKAKYMVEEKEVEEYEDLPLEDPEKELEEGSEEGQAEETKEAAKEGEKNPVNEETSGDEKTDTDEVVTEDSEDADKDKSKDSGGIQPFATINENLITDFKLVLNPGPDEEVIENGSTIDVDLDQMNAVRLIYTLVKPDELDLNEGDTYTIDLPEIFDQTIQSPQPIEAENVVVGTYIIENGQLVITFKGEVNDFDDVEMFVNITGAFKTEIFEVEEEVIVEVPYKDEGSFTVTIRAEQEKYEGTDKKTAGKQYILDGEDKVTVERNPEFIDWTVRVNDSMESFENATVIDDLGENLEIVEDSFIVERIIRNYKNEEIGREQIDVTPTITDKGFELELGNIEDAYDITYTTKLIRPDGGGTHTINNDARIILDGDEREVSDSFEGTWSGDIPSLQKSGKISNANADIINWQVEYNYGREELGSDVILTDVLTDGEVILNTVKVVEVETDIDGNKTKEIREVQVEPVIENGNLIIPDLDANGRAYYITFQSTVPVGLNNVEITNTIEDNYNNKDDASVTVNTVPTGGKVGEQLVDKDGRPYIQWTITMNSKRVDISSINIKDVFSGEHLTFNAMDTSLYELYEDGVEVNNYTVTNYTHSDGRIGFDLNVTDAGPHEYKFVYRTYYTKKGMQEPQLANDAELLFDGGPGVGIGVDVEFIQEGPKAGISKSGKYVLNETTGLQEIEWKITFNNSRILLENPVIKDTFTSKNYKYKDGSLKVKENGQEFTDFVLTTPTEDGFTLNINKETNARYEITYRTTADDAKNEDQINDVELTWQGGTEEDTETVKKRHPGLNKSGNVVINVDGTKSVNWTIDFNTNRNVIHDFKLTDTNTPNTVTINKADIKITRDGEDVTNQFTISEPSNGEFTISIDQLDAVPYQLTYTTTLSAEEEKQDLENTVKVDYEGGSDTKTATIGKPSLGVQKQALSIDKVSEPNRINWKITANTDTANHLVKLVNPVLTDTIPSDQKLVPGTIKVKRVSDSSDITGTLTIDESDNSFEINLPNGAYQYIVTFQTEILEFPSVNEKIDRYTNETTLTNEGYEPVSGDADIDYFADGSNNENTKEGIVNEDTENIDWEATVNPLGLTINKAEIVDKLGGKQTYVIDNDHNIVVKHADGTVFDESKYDLNIANDYRSFTIKFKDGVEIKEPLMVTYSTRLDPEVIGNITVNNEIEMFGGDGRKKISTKKVSTRTSQWTYGGGGSGHTLGFTLVKQDEDGDPIKNAVFDFIRVTPTGNKVPIGGTGITTNNDGIYEIKDARAGRYIVTETSVPEGYQRLTEPIYMIIGYANPADLNPGDSEYIIKITDENWNEIESDVARGDEDQFIIVNKHKPVSVNLKAEKTLKGNKKLEADQFTFELLQGDKVIRTATNDARGNIEFDELTFDKPGKYEYVMQEVKGDLSGVSYDERTYKVTIDVTKDNDGHLEAKVSYGENAHGIPEFVNTYKAKPTKATIKAKKILEGLGLTENQFEFVLIDALDKEVARATNDADGKVVFKDIEYEMRGTYNYTLREVIPNDKKGISYDEKEYFVSVTVEDNQNGELEATVQYLNGPAVFTNSYTPAPDSVVFEASKKLEGKTLGDKHFEFELVDGSGEVVQTVKNNSEGQIIFEEITFDQAGDYDFTIREVEGNLGGVKYDSTKFRFVVHVEDNKQGRLIATVKEVDGPAAFTNTYSPAPDTAVIEAHKILTGQELRNEQFEFELVDSESEDVVQTAKNNARGQIIFEEIEYTEPGEYKYTIREVEGEQRGVTYDDSEFNVTVQVTDNGNGKLETTVIYDDGPAEFNNSYVPLESEAVVLEAEKILNGQKLVDGQFTFELIDESGEVIQTAKNNAEGQVIFEEITYEEPGKHTYIIQEVRGNQGGMTYDDNQNVIVVEVKDVDGKLEAKANYISGPAVFTNYYEADPDSAVIEAKKVLEGQELRTGQFEFQLLDGSENVLQTASNNAQGQIIFDEITFDEVGIYEFSIREVEGTQGGITYDTTVYNLYVEVVDGREGQLIATVNYTDGPAIFTNDYTPNPDSVVIEVEKILEGQDLRNDQFTFELVDESGEVIQTVTNNANGQVIFNEITYDKAGEYNYTIREVEGAQGGVTYDDSEYEVTVTVTDDGEGQLTATVDMGEKPIVFTNTYVPKPDSVVFEATKILEGQDLREGQFEFELLDKSEEVLQTVTNNANGQVIFGEITYDKAGEYKYTIREVKGVQGGVTYDDSEYEVTVTVIDDGEGQLIATEKYSDEKIEFTNYYEADSVTVNFEAEKVLEGRYYELKENEFTFEVLNANGEVVATGRNNAEGVIKFSKFEFNEVGSYEFTIHEVTGYDQDINYDGTIYRVEVEVTDSGKGNLLAEVIYPKEPVFVNEYDPVKVSVGDYVWFDTNEDGLQDETDKPIKGVVLTIEDEEGNPVTDVYGNPVEPVTTDENGYYIFENLPVDHTYTVRIDREASKKVLKDYVPTLHEVGEDNSIDSSTWEATSRHLTEDGDHDPTLDFGFVIEEDPYYPTDPTDPSDPTDPEDPTDPVDPTDPSDPKDPTKPSKPVNGGVIDTDDPAVPGSKQTPSKVGTKEADGDGKKLPSTATNMFNMLAIGLALIILGVTLMMYFRRRGA